MRRPNPEIEAEVQYRQEECLKSARRRGRFRWALGKRRGKIVVWHPKGKRP